MKLSQLLPIYTVYYSFLILKRIRLSKLQAFCTYSSNTFVQFAQLFFLPIMQVNNILLFPPFVLDKPFFL